MKSITPILGITENLKNQDLNIENTTDKTLIRLNVSAPNAQQTYYYYYY